MICNLLGCRLPQTDINEANNICDDAVIILFTDNIDRLAQRSEAVQSGRISFKPIKYIKVMINEKALFSIALQQKEMHTVYFILDSFYSEWVEGDIQSGLRNFNAAISRLTLEQLGEYAKQSPWSDRMTFLYEERCEDELNRFENNQ